MKASNSSKVSTKQQRIAELAQQSPEMRFTSLAYFMDIDWLREAYRLTRKDGAAGVDDVTAADYEANLEKNLQTLLDRAKSGTYRAPPVRRAYLPKSDGGTRPIGIPTLEDKVLQRAVVMLLEPLYEQDFRNCSYGFRPGRSAHEALESLWQQSMNIDGGWILEVDIRAFFDTLDLAHLRELLRQRVRDGVLLRLIDKWLQAGVLEDGNRKVPESGVPQGGVISPLLSNIYLHHVLDSWFEREVKPRLHGRAFLIRYADDFVIGFAREEDARRVMDVLPKRFGKYGLTLHPEKTRLVLFRKPSGRSTKKTSAPGTWPGHFDLLGFTHYWGRSWKGNWVVKRKTSGRRLPRMFKKIYEWCRRQRHDPIDEQHRKLSAKLQGHYGYFGITGNIRMLQEFRHGVVRIWRKWLSRRGSGPLYWDRFALLLKRYPLPPARIVHSVFLS